MSSQQQSETCRLLSNSSPIFYRDVVELTGVEQVRSVKPLPTPDGLSSYGQQTFEQYEITPIIDSSFLLPDANHSEGTSWSVDGHQESTVSVYNKKQT